MATRDYDSTVARIAGNLLSDAGAYQGLPPSAIKNAVELARAIIAEVKRTEPAATPAPGVCQEGWHVADNPSSYGPRKCVKCGVEWEFYPPKKQTDPASPEGAPR